MIELKQSGLPPNFGALDSAIVGQKAAAMAYFSRVGLFDKQLFIAAPSSKNQLIDQIRQLTIGPKGATLRFSRGEELGLPRLFVRTREALVDSIYKLHNPTWTTIVHQYIDVRRSFELNLESSRWVLEHVPGMWESDNSLYPDIARFHNDGEFDVNLFCSERSAKIASTMGTWSISESAPLSPSHMHRWLRRLKPIAATLAVDLVERLPVNVHFVEDEIEGWHFINIRPGFRDEARDTSESPKDFHIVQSIDDVNRWNGAMPILLRVTVSRGSESALSNLALAIKKRTSTIYVDFGLLSHPAIVMREFGLRVLSTSNTTQSFERKRFEHHRLRA